MTALDLLLDAIAHAREALAVGDLETADVVLAWAEGIIADPDAEPRQWISAESLGLLGECADLSVAA